MTTTATYAVITRGYGPFEHGELVVLDESGTELGYPGRDPDEWDCEYEVYETLPEARQRLDEDDITLSSSCT